jgi:hypothetical protein
VDAVDVADAVGSVADRPVLMQEVPTFTTNVQSTIISYDFDVSSR